jgi:hypothetical protein
MPRGRTLPREAAADDSSEIRARTDKGADVAVVLAPAPSGSSGFAALVFTAPVRPPDRAAAEGLPDR